MDNTSFNSTNITYSKGSLPSFYPVEYRVVATILHVLVFCIGFTGNIATIHVVRRTKSMHTPTYCYLVSLAAADLMVLISAVPEAIVSHHLYQGQWVFGQAGCSILVFTNFLGINASSTSICCFTIERYIGICHPLWAQKFCSVERAKKIILGIWVFAIVYCSHWLGLTLIKTFKYPGFPELQACSFRLPRDAYVYFFLADISLFYLIPLLIAIVLYTRIGMVLRQSMKSDLRKNLATIKTGLSVLANGGKAPVPAKDNSLFQVVRMLLVVVISFAILWLPYRGMLVYNSFSSKKFLNIWYLLFAKTSIYLNSAINPILYNLLSKRFRQAFIAHVLPFILHGKCRPDANTNSTAVSESPSTSAAFTDKLRCIIGRKDSSRNRRRSSVILKTPLVSNGNASPNLVGTSPEITPLLPKDPREWGKIVILL